MPKTNKSTWDIPTVWGQLTGGRGYGSLNQKKVSDVETKACSQWANDQIRLAGHKGVGGDAWTPQGYERVASGYVRDRDNRRAAVDTSSMSSINKYTWDSADSLAKYYDPSLLDQNQIYRVNMYYSGSPWSNEAFTNGNPHASGTHAGILKHDGKQWNVQHNYHGTVYEVPLEQVWGSDKKMGVTSIWKPTYSQGGLLSDPWYIPKCDGGTKFPAGYTDQGRTDTRVMSNSNSNQMARVNWNRKPDTRMKYVNGYGYVSATREPDYQQIAAAQEKKAMLANKAKNDELMPEAPMKPPVVRVGRFGTMYVGNVDGSQTYYPSGRVAYYDVPEDEVSRPNKESWKKYFVGEGQSGSFKQNAKGLDYLLLDTMNGAVPFSIADSTKAFHVPATRRQPNP